MESANRQFYTSFAKRQFLNITNLENEHSPTNSENGQIYNIIYITKWLEMNTWIFWSSKKTMFRKFTLTIVAAQKTKNAIRQFYTPHQNDNFLKKNTVCGNLIKPFFGGVPPKKRMFIAKNNLFLRKKCLPMENRLLHGKDNCSIKQFQLILFRTKNVSNGEINLSIGNIYFSEE